MHGFDDCERKSRVKNKIKMGVQTVEIMCVCAVKICIFVVVYT